MWNDTTCAPLLEKGERSDTVLHEMISTAHLHAQRIGTAYIRSMSSEVISVAPSV